MENTKKYRATQCPTSGALVAFDSGDLSPAEIDTIGAHLATCKTCLAFLDSRNQRRLGNGIDGKISVKLADEESARSSMLDETAVQNIRKDPRFQQMVAQVKQIEISVGGDTKPWVPEQILAKRAADKQLPENIGPYFVIDELGSGGFANVYLASDREGRQPVAIKVPRPDRLETPEQIDAYVEEARKSARLKHPHIVPAYFFERTPSGCYVVMKYIEGRSLEKAMKSKTLNFERIAEICAEIAGALDYAHQEGLIHRDIKPANILLDTQGTAYVADFGLAIHQNVQHDHRDEFAGTCSYMSPEQVSPGPHYFDHRTDIWSLGVVLYELLAHEKPFPGKSDSIRIDKIRNHPVKPPRSINSNVPKELERICLKCLEKDITKRTPSGAELAAELRQWLTEMRHKPRVWKAIMWAGGVAIAASVVLAVTLAVMGFFNNGGDDPDPPPKIGDPRKPTSTVAKGDAKTQGTDEGTRPAAEEAVAGVEWESLFDVEPRLFFGHPGTDRMPDFNQLKKTYTVRRKNGPWIATARRIKGSHVRIRAGFSLHNWLGQGGVVWGFQDEDKPGLIKVRWICVQFYRYGPDEPCQLVVRELTLAGPSTILHNQQIRLTEVALPAGKEAILDVEIQPKLLTVTFDKNPSWLIEAPNKDLVSWLPDSEYDLGITSDSSLTVIRDLSLQYLHQE
ncbi:MAG: serine/threonine protein kinase [Pirellulaceae bacterium]